MPLEEFLAHLSVTGLVRLGSCEVAAFYLDRTARLWAHGSFNLKPACRRCLGEEAWRASGIAAPADVTELQALITPLEQHAVDLARFLDERQAEPDAARAANRDLTRALNQRG
ncbi:hypothetical protein OIE52_49730 [Streptomyces canus]|uniref:hypothetical protein n=1 Tax=Streptomyces canus TaxID=58343 RepID=UPI002E2833AD|nr:hypothetical protein [Streptomyces canus]